MRLCYADRGYQKERFSVSGIKRDLQAPMGKDTGGSITCRSNVSSQAPYDINIFDRISQAPTAWDTLVAGKSLFLSRQYLRLLEVHGPADTPTRYAVVMRNQIPLAAVAARIIHVDDHLLAVRDRTTFNAAQRPLGRMLDNGMTWLRNKGLGAAGRHILFCGNPFSCGLHGIVFAADEDPELLWPSTLDALHRMQEIDRQAAFIIVKDFQGTCTQHRRSLLDQRFARLRIEPSMDLRISPSWHTHADYLDSLNAKYRKAARNTWDAIERYGAVVEQLYDLQAEQERLYGLYAQVERHAQVQFGVFSAGYLPALAEMATGFRCSVIRKDSCVVGFSMVLKDGDTAVAHVVGFDYEVNKQAPVYLRLLHQVIADGIALGCREIHFGRTALEPKARLGALPTETEIWVKHRNPVVNRFVGPLLRLVPQDTAPKRKPFRVDCNEAELNLGL